MENLKKWFNFSDTISGTTFIGRWVLSALIQFVGGYSLGYGLAGGISGLMVLGVLITSVGVVLQFSTLLKRSRAIFPAIKSYYAYYMSYVIVSLAYSFLQNVDPILSGFLGLSMLSMFAILIFKNSGTDGVKHIG